MCSGVCCSCIHYKNQSNLTISGIARLLYHHRIRSFQVVKRNHASVYSSAVNILSYTGVLSYYSGYASDNLPFLFPLSFLPRLSPFYACLFSLFPPVSFSLTLSSLCHFAFCFSLPSFGGAEFQDLKMTGLDCCKKWLVLLCRANAESGL